MRDPSARKSVGGRKRRDPKQYYGHTAKMGAVWSIIRQGGHELVAIPTSMIMARLLSPYDFGVAAAASFFILLATRLTQFGFNAAIVRVKELRPEHQSSVLAVNLVMGMVAYLVMLASAPLIGAFFRSPEARAVIPISAVIFLISPFGTVSSALLQRNMQFRDTTLADWTDGLVGSTVSVVLAFLGFGFWSIVYGQIAAATVRVVLQQYLSGWTPTLRFSRESLRELLGFGVGIHAKRVFEYASSNLDNLVVARVLGLTALGYYDKAFTTMNRLVTRLTLGQAPFRIFSIIHEDRERFRRAYARLILSVTLLGFPLLAGCIVVATPLITVLYGERWLPTVVPFQLLCAGGMLKLLNAYASQANEAAGNLWPQVRRQAFGMVLAVIGAWVGSVSAGVTGAALGVVVAMVLVTASLQALVRQATGLSWGGMLAPQVPALICTASLVCVLLGVDLAVRAIIPNPAAWQFLLIQGTAGALFYAGFVLLGPFAAVREIVRETVEDLLPARALDAFDKWSKPLSRA